MQDLYIDDLAEETGNLFEVWAEQHLNMDKMVTTYMKSDFRERADKRYAKACTAMWYDMEELFDKVLSDESYSITLCEWLGYFYTYLQGYTKLSSKELIKKYPFKVMYTKARVLHDLDMELAIKKVLS